ncbi:MAG TPA: membrane dipeptidase [Armatimonadota bacterium]|nr:membrane dipeptidase [Armatimonadota bacterium]
MPKHTPLPADGVDASALRPDVIERIRAGHQALLDEIKPTRAQLRRGLELHYDSYVGDVQGSIQTSYTFGIVSDRLRADLDRAREALAEKMEGAELARAVFAEHFSRKTFESVFDEQWVRESRALYDVAGVHLATSDAAGPEQNSFRDALHRLARIRFVYDRRDDVLCVTGAEDLERGRREGKPCVILHLAGVGCFAESEEPIRDLDLFYALGIRMSQLTYIQRNKLCCSWLQEEDTGLTDMGRQVVARMNELGVMVDLAHCGERSAAETIATSAEPVMLSHTACRSVYDDSTNPGYLDAVLAQNYARGVARPAKVNPRNASDEIIREVGRTGGLVAIYAIDYVLGTGPDAFETFYTHLAHAIEVAGADNVAIGTDRSFFPTWKPSPLDWTNWPLWTVGLVCRGHSDEEIRKIIGGNYLRYATRVLDKRPWGRFLW